MAIFKKIKEWIKRTLQTSDSPFSNHRMVYQTTEMYLANIMKMKLEEEGVTVFILNKRDSSYNNFGKIELYVNENDVLRAMHIIEKSYE